MWDISSRLEQRLSGCGARSIWDLAIADPVQVRKWFNVVVMRTALELRGIACSGPEEDHTGKDQLIVSRSFSEKEQPVATSSGKLSLVYVQQAVARLVKYSQLARRIDAFAGTSHWTEQKH